MEKQELALIAQHYNVQVEEVDKLLEQLGRTQQEVIAEVREYNRKGCINILDNLVGVLNNLSDEEKELIHKKHTTQWPQPTSTD